MPHYKDPTNAVHFIDDATFSHLLPAGSIEITDEEAAVLRAPPPPTAAEIIAIYTAAIQKRLDDFAQTRGYDGILSAATYATSTVPKFKAEGDYTVAARDATWATGGAILAAVEAGTRAVPTLEELAAELPLLVWPT